MFFTLTLKKLILVGAKIFVYDFDIRIAYGLVKSRDKNAGALGGRYFLTLKYFLSPPPILFNTIRK